MCIISWSSSKFIIFFEASNESIPKLLVGMVSSWYTENYEHVEAVGKRASLSKKWSWGVSGNPSGGGVISGI